MVRTFMDKYLTGEVEPQNIDDFIDAWHEGTSAIPLSEYLGMTTEEYADWIAHADALPRIREKRRVKA
jgi:hypothetical protein